MMELETRNADAALVRRYFDALNHGKVLEALNAFSLDARLRDETGKERHGIREIAAAFARRERPIRADIEEMEEKGETVAVRVRMTFPEAREPRVYRGVFQVERQRIRSLVIEPVPSPRRAYRRHSRTA